MMKFKILPIENKALLSDFSDFEDDIQYYKALDNKRKLHVICSRFLF